MLCNGSLISIPVLEKGGLSLSVCHFLQYGWTWLLKGHKTVTSSLLVSTLAWKLWMLGDLWMNWIDLSNLVEICRHSTVSGTLQGDTVGGGEWMLQRLEWSKFIQYPGVYWSVIFIGRLAGNLSLCQVIFWRVTPTASQFESVWSMTANWVCSIPENRIVCLMQKDV